MLKSKKANTKILAPIFLLVAIFLVTLFYRLNRGEVQDLRSLAYTEEESQRYCTNPPECCAAMAKTHDAHECEWPIRGFCQNCGDIEGKNEKCGWYWIWHDKNDNEYKLGTNGENGYGCMIGESPSTMRSKYNKDGTVNTLKPTVPPASPTQIPTPISNTPTSVPIPSDVPIPTDIALTNPPFPTQSSDQSRPKTQITYIPIVVPPYIPPSLTPSPSPFKLNLPNILPPKEKVDSFFTAVKTNLLEFFSKILP